jgi:uncharacterized protein (TIGR00255 family)
VIQSMTGYSEKRAEDRRLGVRVGIKSLNHRFFDWSYKGAPLGLLENRLREVCQKRIQRGKIEVWLDLDFSDASFWDLSINEPLLRKILSALDRAGRSHPEVHFSVENLLRLPQVAELRRRDFSPRASAFIARAFREALEGLIRERIREGRAIVAQLRGHVRTIEAALGRLVRLRRGQPKRLQARLKVKLKDMNNGGPLSEGRLTEEAAYQAQRYDITEEISRLRSHLDGVRALLSPARREPVGKMLDFLAQELYREANTINSKSQDLAITRESLLIKAEVESIRQQVQNLE